jgi:hypothetical protein
MYVYANISLLSSSVEKYHKNNGYFTIIPMYVYDNISLLSSSVEKYHKNNGYFTIIPMYIYDNISLLSSSVEKYHKNNGYFTIIRMYIYDNISLPYSSSEKYSRQVVEEDITHFLLAILFLPENRAVCVIMLKNVAGPDRQYNAVHALPMLDN